MGAQANRFWLRCARIDARFPAFAPCEARISPNFAPIRRFSQPLQRLTFGGAAGTRYLLAMIRFAHLIVTATLILAAGSFYCISAAAPIAPYQVAANDTPQSKSSKSKSG